MKRMKHDQKVEEFSNEMLSKNNMDIEKNLEVFQFKKFQVEKFKIKPIIYFKMNIQLKDHLN